MSAHLVGETTLKFDRSLLNKVKSVLGAIDRGSTLTKIMYATGTDKDQEVELHFALFRNKHFDSALEFLKAKLRTGDGSGGASSRKLNLTGVGGNLYGDKIKEILGVDTEFIDEAYCQFAGFHFLLKHFPLADICDPLPAIDDPVYKIIQRSEIFDRIRETQAAAMKEHGTDDKFPCLFALYGSSAGVILVKEDGSIEVKHRHLLAGKSFLGLCQLLIGTSDYVDIMRLAALGKRGNIDTQVRDIVEDTPNSPYGRMHPSLPFFTFGKAVDHDISLEETRREDIAHSLVSAFTVNFVNTVTFIANYEKVRNVFCGGNFFQGEFPRLELARFFEVSGLSGMVRVNFLRTGHTGALGAMLSSLEDVTDFFAAMKIRG